MADLCSNPRCPSPYIATVTGGLSVHKQQRQLLKADIIIGTPGRLWEVINGTALSDSLKRIRFLVVDEADRLLSEGHFKEMQEILNMLDRSAAMDEGDEDERPIVKSRSKQQRQTLVFSATFQRGLQQILAGKGKAFGSDVMDENESMGYLLKMLNFREDKPKFVDVNPISQMASGLQEGIVECAGTDKVRRKSQVYLSRHELRITGSLPLLASSTLPIHPHSHIHEFDHLSPPLDAFPPEPQLTSLRSPLANATKSPPPIYRAFLLTFIATFHAYRH